MILRSFISLRAFTVYMENSLRFEVSLRSIWRKWNLHQSEFHYVRSHVNADMKLPHTEVKFYPEVQTGLSSLRVSCKHALTFMLHHGIHGFLQLGRRLRVISNEISNENIENFANISKATFAPSELHPWLSLKWETKINARGHETFFKKVHVA